MTELQKALESETNAEIRFDNVSRAIYSTDASIYQIIPAGVVIPRSREDVIRTLTLCRKHGTSITARGGGTSQAGQAIGPGIQVDFSKYMNRIIELHPDHMTVSVEPGIVLDDLNAILKHYGLHLPLDLSTSNRATIGGMIANNSSGTRSVVYGKTLDYVEELTVVMSDSSVVQLKPLTPDSLQKKLLQKNLEGDCYRVVKQLAGDYADEIKSRYPKILRRVGGYNLDEFSSEKGLFNLSKLMVGSEGTLGLTVEAKLRVVPLPKTRAVCVIQFSDLLESLSATPIILEHRPSAVELVDRFILNTTIGKTEFEPLRDFIVEDPAGVLIVEFSGENADELPKRIEHLEEDLRERELGYHVHRAIEPDAQARIWKLRKAALGLSMSQTGDAKAISFVEDTAVAPEKLCHYIERFIAILKREQTQAGFYAHASVGLLHIRPVVNLKSADGIAKFQRIAEQVADLVLEFGGALSGEHGDGLVRASFQQKMFGDELYDAFTELKKTFDPHGVLNPGKIVDAQPLTDNLRFGTAYKTVDLETAFDFSDFGGIARATEQCGGVGACRKTHTGTMCPSYIATRDENDTTRGRANALRLAISGELGEDGLANNQLHSVLDLCLECKACKSECPTGVDMARIKSEFLHQYQMHHGSTWRTRLLANTERMAQWGSRLAPLSNWTLQNHVIRWINERVFGLDRRRMPPLFARPTFRSLWKAGDRTHETETFSDKPFIALFVDTFSNYYEPEHLIATVRIAERLGVNVIIPQHACCGRPLISKGFLKEAVHQARLVTETLAPIAKRNIPIIFCEPGCYSAVRDDHPYLLRGELREQSEIVASASVMFEEWFEQILRKRRKEIWTDERPLLRSGPSRLLLHGHCHQKALLGTGATMRLLNEVPKTEVINLDSGCCGMAGSFGYEHEHYEISKSIGEHRLFPAIREKHAETVVIAPGFSCRHQLQHFTGVKAVSPAVFLESLIEI